MLIYFCTATERVRAWNTRHAINWSHFDVVDLQISFWNHWYTFPSLLFNFFLLTTPLAPQFAMSGSFWQACAILCIISCFNPTTVGASVWVTIPTLKVLLEMLVTKSWKFPPFVVVGQSESAIAVLPDPLYSQSPLCWLYSFLSFFIFYFLCRHKNCNFKCKKKGRYWT